MTRILQRNPLSSTLVSSLLGLTACLSVALAVALAAGCKSRSSTATPNSPTSRVAARIAMPADEVTRAEMTARAISVHGVLKAETADGSSQSLAAGASLDGVSALRSLGKGAVVTLADSTGAMAATVWLRGGTTLRLYQTERGLVAEIDEGSARIRVSQLPAFAVVEDGAEDITGRDVLLYKRHESAPLAFAPTRTAAESAAWSVDLEGEPAPASFGALEVRDADGEAGDGSDQGDERSYLELRQVHVDVESAGDFAYTQVEHIFYNPTDAQLEGTFRFPLPDGAMPLGLAMEIGGRLMEGEIVEREKARRTYESIVDSMQDPALLEWQQGQNFKLRVFPIEARSEKRVILRYASPLAPTVDGWEYVYPSFAANMQERIAHFRLRFDGRVVAEHDDFQAGADVVVPLAPDAVPNVARETIAAPAADDSTNALAAARERMAGSYTAVRVTPDWSKFARDDATAARTTGLVVVVDTSRSSLESRELMAQTLAFTLGELGADDRFALMSADIATRVHVAEPTAVTDATVARILSELAAIESDGASDVGAALSAAAALVETMEAAGHRGQILYIGDGAPTWGITDADALRAHIDQVLPGVVVHAAIMGKGASQRAWRAIAASHTGRMASPRSEADARRFAFAVAHSAHTPRIEDVRIAGLDDAAIYPDRPRTLYRGESMTFLIKTDAEAAPAHIDIEGRHAGQAFKQSMRIIAPADTPLVAQRWASFRIEELERDGTSDDKAAIVEMSKDYGVMSKHTSLLVLESEEAYREHGIERRNMLAANRAAPQVTGGDLESVGEREASLSPDQIQPGDPEIRIPAPADARQVVVIFPFGETKLAHFDEDAQVWVARFLIDKDTPDGKYLVVVQITHASGRVEALELPYFVDTSAPQVTLEFAPRRGGFVVTARQRITSAEMVAMGVADEAGNAGKKAEFLSDARRVELHFEDGSLIALARKRAGVFRRRWRLAEPLAAPSTVRVVVTDEALNQNVFHVRVQPDGSHEVMAPADAENSPE